METRPAGAARGVDQGRKWGEERRKATGKTVLREFSRKVLGWGKVQRASGRGGEDGRTGKDYVEGESITLPPQKNKHLCRQEEFRIETGGYTIPWFCRSDHRLVSLRN